MWRIIPRLRRRRRAAERPEPGAEGCLLSGVHQEERPSHLPPSRPPEFSGKTRFLSFSLSHFFFLSVGCFPASAGVSHAAARRGWVLRQASRGARSWSGRVDGSSAPSPKRGASNNHSTNETSGAGLQSSARIWRGFDSRCFEIYENIQTDRNQIWDLNFTCTLKQLLNVEFV